MNTSPYSLHEAQKKCKEYNHLKGKLFAPGTNAFIHTIAVAPFEQTYKDRFIAFYFLLNDAEMALKQEYNGLLYDVVVLARADDQKLLHESLHAWLDENRQFARAGIQEFSVGIFSK